MDTKSGGWTKSRKRNDEPRPCTRTLAWTRPTRGCLAARPPSPACAKRCLARAGDGWTGGTFEYHTVLPRLHLGQGLLLASACLSRRCITSLFVRNANVEMPIELVLHSLSRAPSQSTFVLPRATMERCEARVALQASRTWRKRLRPSEKEILPFLDVANPPRLAQSTSSASSRYCA